MNRREMLAGIATATRLGIYQGFGPSNVLFSEDPRPDIPTAVTKTDGTVLKGKITAYDKDKITMDVIGKPKDPPVSWIFRGTRSRE